MSGGMSTIAVLVATALLGACVGFIAARLLQPKGLSAQEQTRTADRPVIVHPPEPAVFIAAHAVETELSDAEIDALPVDLPFLAHTRPRIASPPRKRAMNQL